MIKTAQTPCQSHCIGIGLFKTKLPGIIDNRDDVMLILYEMLYACSIEMQVSEY